MELVSVARALRFLWLVVHRVFVHEILAFSGPLLAFPHKLNKAGDLVLLALLEGAILENLVQDVFTVDLALEVVFLV